MAPYWWTGNSQERYWVEIRKLPGIGTSLACPDHQHSDDGETRPNPWYELVRSVRKGEIIYHYNEREKRFVGRSVAAHDGAADPDDESYRVELKDFRPITAAIDLAYLRHKESTLYSLRESLRAAHPGQVVYSPFQFRGTELYGMMSNYFAKLPRDVVLELFGSDGFAEKELTELHVEDGSDDSDGPDPGPSRASYLRPFKPKADTDYMTEVVGGRPRRTRRHEFLINKCAAWLEEKGFEPMRNSAVDLGLEDPAVLIEGKTVGASWATAVRQAVSQLYEYRYFKVADPASELIFLTEREPPADWIRYLERDREIGVMWPKGQSYELSSGAADALGF